MNIQKIIKASAGSYVVWADNQTHTVFVYGDKQSYANGNRDAPIITVCSTAEEAANVAHLLSLLNQTPGVVRWEGIGSAPVCSACDPTTAMIIQEKTESWKRVLGNRKQKFIVISGGEGIYCPDKEGILHCLKDGKVALLKRTDDNPYLALLGKVGYQQVAVAADTRSLRRKMWHRDDFCQHLHHESVNGSLRVRK